MQKHIKIAAVILCLCFGLVVLGAVLTSRQVYNLARGNYFFSASRDNTDINTITLTFPNHKKITIRTVNNLWRIQEADDYFASPSKINSLVNLLRNSLIYRADTIINDKHLPLFADSLKIETADPNGKIIDSAQIAPRLKNNKHHYALLNQNNILYQLSGNFHLSSHLSDWIDSPILTLEPGNIKRVTSDDFDVYRPFFGDDFRLSPSEEAVPQIKALITNFRYLTALDVKHSVHFNLKDYQKVKHYSFLLFNGLTYHMDIYNKQSEYWLNIRLARQSLADSEAVKILNDATIFYEGWFFQINETTGQLITGFVL